MIPEKLKLGDEIRIVAPSRSMGILAEEIVQNAKKALEAEGFNVSFGRHVREMEDVDYKCASIEARVEDLHEAYADERVKAMLTVIGGYNVNQILEYLDYHLIQTHPKILCGFSDITALTNSIYTKTGVVTYSGMHFSSFGMKKGKAYSVEYFRKMLMQTEPVIVEASKEWSNDSWFKNQEDREFIPNEGMCMIQEGTAEGTIIGGNLCTLNLLQGTEYMPNLENSILFLEDDEMAGKNFLEEFDRNLQSLLHAAKGNTIQGIVLGRAEKACDMTIEKWKKIIQSKKELAGIPVIANADFGHTTPIFTFPIGGYAKLHAKDGKIELEMKG